MITKTGRNLSILIVTEPGKDWETFATWYSFYHNLPEATVSITSIRNGKPLFQLYQWTKRLNVPLVHHNPFCDQIIPKKLDSIKQSGRQANNLMVVEPLVMAIDCLSPKILEYLNKTENLFDDHVWFFKNCNISGMIDEFMLENRKLQEFCEICFEAKETENIRCLISYKKGCGKWIDTLRGCPLSNAAGLVSTTMTVNENRVIELWKKMCPLYSALT